jgi:hypothetical protein
MSMNTDEIKLTGRPLTAVEAEAIFIDGIRVERGQGFAVYDGSQWTYMDGDWLPTTCHKIGHDGKAIEVKR